MSRIYTVFETTVGRNAFPISADTIMPGADRRDDKSLIPYGGQAIKAIQSAGIELQSMEGKPFAAARKDSTLLGLINKEIQEMPNDKLLNGNPGGDFGIFQILSWTGGFTQSDGPTFFIGRTNNVVPPTPPAPSTESKHAFVLMLDGYIRIGIKHISIAHGAKCYLAGEVAFNGNGKVRCWNTFSGTYLDDLKSNEDKPHLARYKGIQMMPFVKSRYTDQSI
jgi:hypothetical protein